MDRESIISDLVTIGRNNEIKTFTTIETIADYVISQIAKAEERGWANGAIATGKFWKAEVAKAKREVAEEIKSHALELDTNDGCGESEWLIPAGFCDSIIQSNSGEYK